MEPQPCVLNRVLTKYAVSCNCMSRRVDDNTNAREYNCGLQRVLVRAPTVSRNLKHRVQVHKAMSNSASTCIHSGPLCARQQHLLVPAPSEVARAAASTLLKIGNQVLHTSYTSKAWPKFLIADAAVSTPVFAPPLMPIHDTRLRFGGVMRFRTKRISHHSNCNMPTHAVDTNEVLLPTTTQPIGPRQTSSHTTPIAHDLSRAVHTLLESR